MNLLERGEATPAIADMLSVNYKPLLVQQSMHLAVRLLNRSHAKSK